MFENDVSREGDIGLLLVASGGGLMLVAGALALVLAMMGPSEALVLSTFV